jgi:hypothetical protein
MAWITQLLVARFSLLQAFEFFDRAALVVAIVIFPTYEDDS